MPSLLFVHGTGVRRASFDETFGVIQNRLARLSKKVIPYPCFWGEKHGSVLHGGSSLGRDTVSDTDEIELWSSLSTDPLAELRFIAHAATPPEWPMRADEGERLAQKVAELPESDAVRDAITDTPLNGVFAEAVSTVITSDATKQALFSSPLHSDIRQL